MYTRNGHLERCMKEISTITANGKQLEIIYSMAHRGLAPLRLSMLLDNKKE